MSKLADVDGQRETRTGQAGGIFRDPTGKTAAADVDGQRETRTGQAGGIWNPTGKTAAADVDGQRETRTGQAGGIWVCRPNQQNAPDATPSALSMAADAQPGAHRGEVNSL